MISTAPGALEPLRHLASSVHNKCRVHVKLVQAKFVESFEREPLKATLPV